MSGDLRHDVNLSVYLVTGRELLPPGVDYYASLEESLRDGHVTVVQLREKSIGTDEFLDIAKRSLAICDRYRVPMLINDNISVALALPDRVGLHIGQTDIPVARARELLGPGRLLGLSVHNIEQARQAAASDVADYYGVGPVYGTKSKAGIEEKDVLSPRGAREVVKELGDARAVLIGGINQKNAMRAMFGATTLERGVRGIAVISAIVGRRDPGEAAKELAEVAAKYHDLCEKGLHSEEPFRIEENPGEAEMLANAARILQSHRSGDHSPPVIQTLTSHVSSTLSANIALAFGASPIMSHQEAEAEDLGRVTGAVVLNIGTIGDEARRGMRAVGSAANRGGKPVLLDPVGVGASAFRKEVVNEIMDHTQITLLKGNAAELSAIAGLGEVQSRGVDSGSGTLSDPEGLIRSLASRERCLVLMTGKIDYLTDGNTVVRIHNGHELLGRITGSGCALGVAVAAGMAAACNISKALHGESFSPNLLGGLMVTSNTSDLFCGALMGVLSMTIAAEIAAERPDVKGPGSFIAALIDEVAAMTPAKLIGRAKIDVIAHGC